MRQDKLSRCRRCGQMRGLALAAEPYDGPSYYPVRCICKGIPCRGCGKRMVRRPISNHYDEPTGAVWHTPWFMSLARCRVCRQALR
jgi:hypothetical protein